MSSPAPLYKLITLSNWLEFAWRSAFDGIDFQKRRIDFLALEMKERDEHVIATIYKNGFELVRVLQNEDYCFRRVE